MGLGWVPKMSELGSVDSGDPDMEGFIFELYHLSDSDFRAGPEPRDRCAGCSSDGRWISDGYGSYLPFGVFGIERILNGNE